MTLTVGSLFSGIGGIDLGLERAGMKVLWQVEIDEWCRAVLAKHWPDVERFEDVRSVGRHNLGAVDVLAGGFPCQDISQAGKGAGIKAGTRSGLWIEYARIIRELRPQYVLVENVAVLRSRGLDVVLGDLAACGYDAEWDCIPASAVGAPHQRDRLWLVGHRQERERPDPDDTRSHRAIDEADDGRIVALDRPAAFRPTLAHADSERSPERGQRADAPGEGAGRRDDRDGSGDVAGQERVRGTGQGAADVADAGWNTSARHEQRLGTAGERDWWGTEPNVGRVAHGVPARVDRLRGLGNAVVPQVVEWIGRRIVEAEALRPEQ